MANDQRIKLEAVISASAQGMVDALKRASAAVNDSTASWKDRLGRARGDLATVSDAVRNLGAELGKVGQLDLQADSGALDKIRESLAGASGAFSTVQTEVEALKASLVGLREQASALGMPVEEYQRFGEAVKAAGVDAQAAEGMISSMRSRIQDFANGVPEAVELFGRLGVTLDQLGSRSPAQNFSAIADAIQATVPATEHAETSLQMYGHSMDHVIAVAQEYTRTLEHKSSSEYASDRDIQGAIGLADALGRVGQSLDGVASRMRDAGEAGAQTVNQAMEAFDEIGKALDAYNQKLYESAHGALDIGDAYRMMQADCLKFMTAIREMMVSASPDSFRISENLNKIEETIETFTQRFRHEFENIQDIMARRFELGGKIDLSELEKAFDHISMINSAIHVFRRGLKKDFKVDFNYGAFDGAMRKLDEYRDKLLELRSKGLAMNMAPGISSLSADLDAMVARLDEMAGRPVRLRAKVDTAEVEDLRRRLEELRSMAESMTGSVKVGNVDVSRFRAYMDSLTGVMDKMRQVDGLMHVLNSEQERLNAEARNGVSVWTMMGRGLSSVGSAIAHPVEAARRLADHVRQAWQWMTRFRRDAQGAGGDVNTTGRQLGQVAGMLTGMGSKVMIIVKGFRLMADAAKNVAKWFTEASKRQAEMQAGMAGDAGEQFKANRKATEEREAAIKRYVELLDKARDSGSSADAAAAEAARMELWERHGVEANEGNARQVFREISEGAYDERIDQNEAETRMYKELVPQWRKAIEERRSYLSDVFGKGMNLEQKLGEDTVLTDLVKKLGDAQRRLGELALERQELGRTRRGAAYYDYAAGRGGRAEDERRRMMEQERERARKAREDRAKSSKEAAGELADWNAELNLDDVERRIRDVWKKYARIVERGGDREEAYQAALAAVAKIREEAAKRLAEEQEREAEEAGRRAETLENAREREEDARRRLYEATKGLAEAQEREAYRMRLDAIGKARERLRRKMDAFGFTLPDGFRSSRPNLSARERRTIRLDDRIADKLARRQAGGHVHFTARERERIRELERLQRRDKALTAEEKAMQAAQTQQSAADTMQSAASQFSEAVKGLQKAVEERMKAEGKAGGKAPERSAGGTPSPAPMPRPRPRPRPAAVEEEPAPRKLDRDEYASRYRGDPARLDEYYRKYSESYDRRHGVKRDAGRINAGLANSISRLYAPPRYADTGAGTRDYTSLLERIETAIKNNKGNLTLK